MSSDGFPASAAALPDPRSVSQRIAASLARRSAAERRFKALGLAAIVFAMSCLGVLLFTIASTALPAFTQTMIRLDVTLSAQEIDPAGTRDPHTLATADYQKLVRDALGDLFPEVSERRERRGLAALLSPGASYALRAKVIANPSLIGRRITLGVPFSDDIDQFAKGRISADTDADVRRVSDRQIDWFHQVQERGLVHQAFNTTLFTAGDSRSPELAGIWGALVGSLWTMTITLAIAFPLAVGAAIYLEEFAPKNRWSRLIEVNINNLAAVPSIVFGLLGLAVFINILGVPRSTPVVGGMVLALMTLPVIIIASRAALKAVPPSVREAALGIGASKVQTVFHHVVPMAMPGMLTGTILGMAHALGETAPLLMIGMVAFIVDIPASPLDPATVMPVQIYLWADSPERAFVERASAAILVLLGFLVAMNVVAVILRKYFERKW